MINIDKWLYYHPIPARILHWIIAAGIMFLIFSGLYIRDPVAFPFFTNMDTARKIHFIVMYIVIYGAIVRIYYSYISRDYARLLFRPRDVKDFPALLKYYFFLRDSVSFPGKYNPGQKLLYSSWFLMIFLQALSGFMLYRPDLFPWPVGVLGSLFIRQFHFMMTWIFISTIAVHIYLAFVSGLDVVKSMITGWYCSEEQN